MDDEEGSENVNQYITLCLLEVSLFNSLMIMRITEV